MKDLPDKVSELKNDSGFQTANDVDAAINAKLSTTYKASGSLAFANLPAADAAHLGMVYNVTDAFTTTSNFMEGAGNNYPVGTNVVIVADGNGYKYDVLAGFVDLSGYMSEDDMQEIVADEVTNLWNSVSQGGTGTTGPSGGGGSSGDLSSFTGILPIKHGGTGNDQGYIRTGLQANVVPGDSATAEGKGVTASGMYSHAEGSNTTASADSTHAEGWQSKATDSMAHAEGFNTEASGYAAHAEGNSTQANGSSSHAEGNHAQAGGLCSHAEGFNTQANYAYSHAEGSETKATADSAHAEGNNTTASGICAHAEGCMSNAIGHYSHAEGSSTANGVCSHSEGGSTAEGNDSHAEGIQTHSIGEGSQTEGYGTTSDNGYSHAGGHYNRAMTTGGTERNTVGDAMVIGNGVLSVPASGTIDVKLSNCFRVTYSGAVYGLSAFNSTGADYAEYFEWADGNPDSEDRVGYFVTLDGKKIRKAKPGDYILGIISGQPCIIGNADEDWLGRWEHDEFGRFVREDVDTPITKRQPILDAEGRPTGEFKDVETGEVSHGWRFKANPDYDASQPYVERRDRPEWNAVGMMGVLSVRDDGSCQVNGFCQVAPGGIATVASAELAIEDGKLVKGWRVLERVSDNVVKVVFR